MTKVRLSNQWCPSGKQIHPSSGKACAALRSLYRLCPDYSGKVYPCTECLGWHVGRRKKRAHTNKYD